MKCSCKDSVEHSVLGCADSGPRPGCVHDDPRLDCTDGAHSAWWRGEEASFKKLMLDLRAVLDGETPCGVCSEPWETIRQEINALVKASYHMNLLLASLAMNRQWCGPGRYQAGPFAKEAHDNVVIWYDRLALIRRGEEARGFS